jgi:EAL domain-containing protein (putative c-di-GMP-specific phosphodiesterase class I)
MYEAKYKGLKIASYHVDMDRHRYEDLQLSVDLKDGVDSGQFEAVFQPKIDLKTNRPCGCELLTQWRHPHYGLISPLKFIPLAERENLIGKLTLQVFERSAKQLKSIIENSNDFQFSINVSPLNLLDTTLLSELKQIMHTAGFPTSRLTIEVTENAIMTNPLRSARVLEEFAESGIQISVDDFGTGYSSLSYLQKFPIHELKIDKSFVIGLHETSNNYPIVNATIAMAHDLGMTVVAEGVEDLRVLQLLEKLGCNRVQGYHFSKALTYDELAKWLGAFDMSEFR